MIYKIEQFEPTGEKHDMFGTEYHIKFDGQMRSFKLWFKEAPTVGKEVDGNIEGDRFKKIKKEYNGGATSTVTGYTPRVDNSDGQRQGMCLNNASNYVTKTQAEATPDEWAKQVYNYANALYALGNLDGLGELDNSPKTDLKNVAEIFG